MMEEVLEILGIDPVNSEPVKEIEEPKEELEEIKEPEIKEPKEHNPFEITWEDL